MTDRYRKKPVEVRAWKIGFDGQAPDWVRKAFDDDRIDWCPAGEGLYISTLEGDMKACIGDMLIEGVKGELYGCRADIFAATYEPVETTLAAPSVPAQPATEQQALRELQAEIERLAAQLTAAQQRGQAAPPSAPAGVEDMQRRLDREESDHARTIDQRDAAEDALGRMFQAVTGRTAEWSSAWGYVDAIEEVEEHVATLAAERDQLAAALEAAREDAERWRALRELDGGEIYALLGDCDGIHPEQADAAIDRARGKGVQS